ncbi:MAG: GNAT family N-acetyltransferase [Halovenus sp.]
MMAHARFRQATPSDAETVLRIKQAAIDGIDGAAYDSEQRAAWRPGDDDLPAFERAIRSDRFDILIAEVDGDPAGYGVLNRDANRIDAIFVRPAHSREGIATSLLNHLEAHAQLHGIPELKIVSSLNARPFYQIQNYWEFGTEVRTIDGVDIEFAIMRKSLDIA